MYSSNMFPFPKKKTTDSGTPNHMGLSFHPSSTPSITSYALPNASSQSPSYLSSSTPTAKLEQPTQFTISSSPVVPPESLPGSYYEHLTPATLERGSSNDSFIPAPNYQPGSKRNNSKLGANTDNERASVEETVPSNNIGGSTSYNPTRNFSQNQHFIQNQLTRPVTKGDALRRVWVRKNQHTATTITVGPNDIVDDLKYMIANKFPTTLARSYDPSDLIIKMNIPFDTKIKNNTPLSETFALGINPQKRGVQAEGSQSPHSINNASFTRFQPPQPITEIKRSNTPLSPETTLGYSLSNEPTINDSIRCSSRTIALEPDLLVCSVLDKYFPGGMKMSDAFIIDTNVSPTEDTFKPEFKQRLNHSLSYSGNLNDRNDTIQCQPIPVRPQSMVAKKVATLGNQKVPPPRLRPSATYVELSNPAPQSSAVILFSKDVRDDSKSPLNISRDLSTSPPKKLSTVPPPLALSNSKTSESDQGSRLDTVSVKRKPDPILRPISTSKGQLSDSTVVSSPNSVSTITPNAGTKKNNKKSKGKLGISKMLTHINVLVVEDNLVNQKIMAHHLKSCNVQFQIASTGKEALEIWKRGGFHLCFMDIQLPVMSGIEVTKEIRRLERLNHIGSISTHASEDHHEHKNPADILDLSLFRSPIIIVALTASTGAADQQNALAAGCNDYLTKPVQLKWLRNKLTEWGYMQALINYDYFRTES